MKSSSCSVFPTPLYSKVGVVLFWLLFFFFGCLSVNIQIIPFLFSS